eukprot:scaffold5560_cov444-Prasinococcus_capsulatus_cf.AAC.10
MRPQGQQGATRSRRVLAGRAQTSAGDSYGGRCCARGCGRAYPDILERGGHARHDVLETQDGAPGPHVARGSNAAVLIRWTQTLPYEEILARPDVVDALSATQHQPAQPVVGIQQVGKERASATHRDKG